MKSLLYACAFLLAANPSAYSAGRELDPGKYNIDPAHTRVSFLIDHFVVSQVQGRFNDVEGHFTLSQDMSKNEIQATVPIASIDTAVKKRDDHLRSEDFFHAEKYPTMTFKSKSFKGDLDDFEVTGDLTIKDVTKEVTLEGEYNGSVKDSWGNIRASIELEGEINRKDFNVNYHDVVEAGPVVGDEVEIEIIAQGTHAKAQAK